MSVRIDERAKKLSEEFRLMDTERALVTLRPGVVWSYLKQEDRTIGIAFHGPSRFAVDAIVETEYGATGESVAAELEGIQLYFGLTELESISEDTFDYDLSEFGYSSIEEFHASIQKKLDGNRSDKDNKFDIEGDAGILIGEDEFRKKVILVAKEDSTVFTYDKRVFVVGGDSMVSVEGSRISIGGPDRQTVIIDKDRIKGLEELNAIGPAISRAMTSVARSIPRLTKDITHKMRCDSRPHRASAYGAYDNVDEFDWPD